MLYSLHVLLKVCLLVFGCVVYVSGLLCSVPCNCNIGIIIIITISTEDDIISGARQNAKKEDASEMK